MAIEERWRGSRRSLEMRLCVTHVADRAGRREEALAVGAAGIDGRVARHVHLLGRVSGAALRSWYQYRLMMRKLNLCDGRFRNLLRFPQV